MEPRKSVEEMTDREIQIETLELLRKLDTVITGVIEGMTKNPMFKMMAGKMGLS